MVVPLNLIRKPAEFCKACQFSSGITFSISLFRDAKFLAKGVTRKIGIALVYLEEIVRKVKLTLHISI